MVLSNSVSIQRVCTVNGDPSDGANASSATTARWNGVTVGMPSMTSSSRARRARSMRLLARSRPVTMSLAIIESNAPATVSPSTRPASQRTPGPCGTIMRRDRAGRRQEAAAGVLAVDAELDGVRVRLGVGVVERLAVGDAELLAHEVDAGDLLGDRVLDLEAGVDLEEADVAVRADEELAGAGADVAGRAQDRLGRADQLGVLLLGDERGGGLLDELLVAALQRAVAGRDDDDVAVLVGQALGLDVARLVEEALDEALAAPERRDGLAHRGLEQVGDLLDGAGDLQAAAAAAVGRLDGDGQPDAPSRRPRPRRVRRPGRRCRARGGRPAFVAMCRALTLSPRASMASGPGPIQVEARRR